MTDEKRKLSITYSSGLIPPPEIMGTLAVFYDEIWLPNPYEAQAFIVKQRDQLTPLFANGILRVLPLLDREFINRTIYTFERIDRETGWRVFSQQPEYVSKREEIDKEYKIAKVLAIHSLCAEKPSPELFLSNPTDTSTSRLAGFLARSLFDYKVPQLQALNAEQILEVRDYLKDTKEAFTYYIYEQVAEVEKRIQEWNQSEMVAAQQTFEQKILPQYAEFQRKLAAKKLGFWSKVAAVGGTFLLVNTAPRLGAPVGSACLPRTARRRPLLREGLSSGIRTG